MLPLLGQVFGPIPGGFLTEYASWRWAFYVSSIIDACVQIFGLLFLDEPYTPVIYRRKKQCLLKKGSTNLYTEHDFPSDSKMTVMKTTMIRPFKLLTT
jgi:MFS family permease